MIKKIFAVTLAICIFLLSGCQLAVPDGINTPDLPDPLIGVLVTEEYLDLFDMDAWLQENTGKLNNKQNLTAPVSEKLYGTTTEDSIAFGNTEGMVFASYYAPSANEVSDGGYWCTIADAGINHVNAAYNRTDESNTVTLSASIYMSIDAEERVFYFNPIYQTKSGEVYVCSGQGMSMSSGLGGEMSHKLQADAPEGPDGNGMRYSSCFDVRIKTVEVPQAVTLLHVDDRHNILKKSTYTPDTMPQEVTPEPGTAYILVEWELINGTQRFLSQPGDKPLETFQHADSGLCDIVSTTILWPEAP